MSDVIATSLDRPRFVMQLLVLFAAVAVVLATVGIYGVVSYAVAQRSRPSDFDGNGTSVPARPPPGPVA